MHKIVKEVISPIAGVDDEQLHQNVTNMLRYLQLNGIDYSTSIECISDLISLKENNNHHLRQATSQLITKFIVENYNNVGLVDLPAGEHLVKNNDDFERTRRLLCFTTSTLMKLERSDETKKFLYKVLSLSNNWLEESSFEGFLKYYFDAEYDYIYTTDAETVQKVVKAVNKFCEEEIKERQWQECHTAIVDTLEEHNDSYSLTTCYKSDLYVSPCKRSEFVGLGKVFVDKTFSRIARSGSAPIDWVQWFEGSNE